MIPRDLLMLLLWCALGSSAAFAIDDRDPIEDPTLQARYEHLTEELRCVKCQNQTIADSNAGIAKDLRLKVREMLLAGRSDQEIFDYMVERYGQFVLYRPPFNPSTWLLWFAPFLLLGFGGLVVFNILRHHDGVEEEEGALDEELAADRGELGDGGSTTV